MIEDKTGMKVWGWAADNHGCFAYRLRWPLDAVDPLVDWDIRYGTTIMQPHRDEAEVVIGQRVCLDGPTKLWRKWHDEGRRLVYEIDDDFWSIPEYNENAFHFYRRKNVQENIAANIRLANTVTCSTEPLAAVLRERFGHPDIRVIPNAVPPWLIEHEPDLKFDLGWGGSATHRGDFDEVRRHLRRVLEDGTRFHVFGSCPDGLENLCEVSGWTKTPEDFLRAIDYRVGIAPLVANRFNRSKSNIKVLELAALGRPSIGSDFGPYADIEHGVTGLKIKYNHEWGRALRSLLADRDRQDEMGRAAREWASTRTTAHTAQAWMEAIKG